MIARLLVSSALTLVCIGLAPAAIAGWPCSIDKAYPEVTELHVQDGRLVGTLGTHFAETTEGAPGYPRRIIVEHPQLSMSANGSWTYDKMVGPPTWWSESRDACVAAPAEPDVELAKQLERYSSRGGSWFNQNITSCASDGEATWGGIAFYGGEGGWGVPGLVRLDSETGESKYVRPPNLKDSAGPLAYFAGNLWLGVSHGGECGGPPSGAGLKRLKYYLQSDWYVLEEVPEVCGFAIRDFQEFGDALWVATELGLSRLSDGDTPTWSNYVPDLEHPGLMREVSCDELYTELLTSSEFAATAGFDIGNAFDVFWRRLSSHRPEFTTRYLRTLHGHPVEDYPR